MNNRMNIKITNVKFEGTIFTCNITYNTVNYINWPTKLKYKCC